MSWYNDNIQNGFIDTTQEFVGAGGGGEGGGTVDLTAINTAITNLQQELLTAQTNLNNISDDISDINAVFIPKQINNVNETTDTIIKNNTVNSRIFLQNTNATPKIKIEGGKLYLYYDYSFTNAPTITAGWIDVDNYITAIKQDLILEAANIVTLDTTIFAPTVGLLPRVVQLEILTTTTTAKVISLEVDVAYLMQAAARNTIDGGVELSEELTTNLTQAIQDYRNNALDASDNLSLLVQNSAYNAMGAYTETATSVANALYNSKSALYSAHFANVINTLVGAGVIVSIISSIYDFFTSSAKEKDINKLLILYEKVKDDPQSNIPRFIHVDGLLIISNTNNGFSTFNTYKITLSNLAILRIKTNGPSGLATIVSVETPGSATFEVFNNIYIPKSQLGGTSGDLQIRVISLISEVKVLTNLINKTNDDIVIIQNRRRLRDGIINTDELGDGLTVAYNSTLTNAETGEVLQVPTIKLNYNTSNFETVSGAIHIKPLHNNNWLDPIATTTPATFKAELLSIRTLYEEVWREAITLTEQSALGTPTARVASRLASKTEDLREAYLDNALVGISNGTPSIFQIWDVMCNSANVKLEKQILLLHEKLGNTSQNDFLKHIHRDGLQIVDSTNNGVGSIGQFYNVTLSNGGIITFVIGSAEGVAKAYPYKVKEVGNPIYTEGQILDIPKNSLGGTAGTLQIQVMTLISEKQVLRDILNSIKLSQDTINNRRRIRDGVISKNELSDGLVLTYTNSTQAETGEVLQVPTVKVKLNTNQFETISGAIQIKPSFLDKGLEIASDKLSLDLNTAQFNFINNDLNIIGYDTALTNIATIQTDITALETDVATLQTDVATIVGLNTDVVDLLDDVATLKTDVISINGNIGMINGNIDIIDLDIVDVNASLDRIYKVLLPTGATMTSDDRINLGFKEIYSGFPYDLIMLAVRSGIYTVFNADDYNNDFLGLYPNMIRLAGSLNYNVYDTDTLEVNASQYFTKGFIYFKKINENYITNLNNKFEFVSFLKFSSFNNNTTDYHILQSTDALGVSTGRLSVWLRNRKLNIRHPALVQYLINDISTNNYLTTNIINNSYVSLTTNDDNLILAATIIPKATPEYRYKISFLNNTYAVHLNNDTRFSRVINSGYTTEPVNSEDYLRMYLSHPNNGNLPIASGVYPSLVLDIGKLTTGGYDSDPPPTNIKRVTIQFNILYTTMYGIGDEQPVMNQYNYAETVERCDFTFRFRYSFDGTTFINHDFTMANVSSTMTNVGNFIYDGFGSFVGATYFPKKYFTYTFDIAGTYPAGTGQKIKYLEFSLVKKPGATYQYGTTTDKRYNFQPILYLFKYIVNDYNTVGTPYQVVVNDYTTADVSNAFSTSIFTTTWYLLALQLDLPNNNIGFYLKGIYNNFITRNNYTLTSAHITMPDTITTLTSTFVSWANLTQDAGNIVIGNIPTVGSIQFTHFNWKFFQDLVTPFMTSTEITKLTSLINYGYYEEYVAVDKLLTAGEIITYNLDTTNITLNKKQLIKPMTTAIRTRDLRTEQTQDPANVLIRLDNLYVEDPVSSGTIYYDLGTKTFTVGGGGGGSGIGTRSEEDDIILGFIEDAAGFALQWNNITKTLNVIPEYIWQDQTPIYDEIALSRTQTSNYVRATSNYLKGIIDNIPPPAPYDDTAVYTQITTTSNILFTDFVARDAVLNTQITTTSNILFTDFIARDAILNTQITTTSNILFTDFVARDALLNTQITTTSNILFTDFVARDALLNTQITTTSNILFTDFIARDALLNTQITTTSNILFTDFVARDAVLNTKITTTSNILFTDFIARDALLDTKITTTSNILFTNFVARDAVLVNDYIARDDIITLDSIERDDNLSASIEANKYTDTKVLNLLGSSTSLVFKELTLAKDATTALSFIKYATGTTNIQAYTQLALLGNQTDIHMFFSTLQYLTFTIVGIIILQIQAESILANKTLTITGTNQLNFQTGTVSLPATITGGTGCKIIYYPSTTTYPYATGVNGSTLWHSVPNGARHEFYVNGVRCMRTATTETILSSTGESTNCILGFSTPFDANTTKYGCAIIAEAQTNWSRANLCLCVNNVANSTTSASITSSIRMRMWYYAWTEFYGTYGSPSGLYSYFSVGNTTVLYATTSFSNTCVKVNGSIWVNAGSVAVSSTREIKKEIEELDDQECLNKLLQLKPCKYRYIDNTLNKHPTKKVFGFIAEEVKEVIPEAVDDNLTGVIPNIYENAEVQGDILTILTTTKTLEIDKIYTCYGEENDDKIIIKVLEDLGDGDYKIDKTYDNKINLFIYGKEIDNYHALKKEYLHALAISAIQEHNKIIMKQKGEIADLTARLAKLEAVIGCMLSGVV